MYNNKSFLSNKKKKPFATMLPNDNPLEVKVRLSLDKDQWFALADLIGDWMKNANVEKTPEMLALIRQVAAFQGDCTKKGWGLTHKQAGSSVKDKRAVMSITLELALFVHLRLSSKAQEYHLLDAYMDLDQALTMNIWKYE